MAWTVYLARCADGSLYTGITTDPGRRMVQHNRGTGAAYTRSRLPVILVYCEDVKDRARALRREHAIRRLTREEKEALASEWVPYVALRSAPA
jgi:putative endonuclease